MNNKIAQIETAIEKAMFQESKLSAEILSLEGMSSPRVRHLLNNLGSISKSYFEVGSWKGASLISTCFGNELLHLACDNFTEFNPEGDIKHELINNCARFVDLLLIDDDCWKLNELPFKPDLFLFDGGHSVEDHEKALTHFAPMLADECVVVIDDHGQDPGFSSVVEGTNRGLELIKETHDVLYRSELFTFEEENHVRLWWNGLLVLLLKRKA